MSGEVPPEKDVVEDLVAKANSALGTDGLSSSTRRWVFTLIILSQAVTNFDNGAVAATIGEEGPLSKGLGISRVEEGTLGSIIYIGSTVGCALTSWLFSKASAKLLMWSFMAINTGFALMFAAAPNFVTACIARFFVGFSHAVLVVYSPVWVDEFAPKESSTTWMSLIQAGAPIGIMLGYVGAGVVTAAAPEEWRWIFYAQTIALGALTIALLLVPSLYMNPSVVCEIDETGLEDILAAADKRAAEQSQETTPENRSLPPLESKALPPLEAEPKRKSLPSDEKQQQPNTAVKRKSVSEGPPSPGQQIKDLVFNNGLFMSTMTALCSLYFVVTGLQLWVTAYLRGAPVYADMAAIVPAFGLTSATAPVFGVVFGGVLLDKLGGYSNIDRAAELGIVFGGGALVPAIMCLTVENFWIFIANIWVMLFFGGAVVPTATGLSITSAPKEIRSTASSLLGVTCNLLGYFLGPMLCGIVAEAIGDLRWGFRLVMGWAVFAFLSMIFGYRAAKRLALENKPYDPFTDVFEPRLVKHLATDRKEVTRAAAEISSALGGSFVLPTVKLNVTLRPQIGDDALDDLAKTQRNNGSEAMDMEAVAAMMKNSSFAALSSLDLKKLDALERNAMLKKMDLGELDEVKKMARRTTVRFKVNPRIAQLQMESTARKRSLVQGSGGSAGPTPRGGRGDGDLMHLEHVPVHASPLPSPQANASLAAPKLES